MAGIENEKGTGSDSSGVHFETKPETTPPRSHNWVTDLYDRANLTVRQLNIMLVVLVVLIFALFVIFGK